MNPSQFTRRHFFRQTGMVGTTAAVASPWVLPRPAAAQDQKVSPNEKIQLGIIGCNGMGRSNLANCAEYDDVEVVAVCEVMKSRRDAVLKQHPGAKGYNDFRELLANDAVDAVIIATPPHWHCLMAVEAAKAGKDIYLQKPMTLHLGESLAVKNAVRRHDVVCQIGTQIHAQENYRRVVEKIQAGTIGQVSVARTFNVLNQGPDGIGRVENTTVPEGLDWDMWLGPGPERSFNATLFTSSYFHCSFMDYSGGWTPGMAPHIVDLPVWALEVGYPTTVSCAGGRYIIEDDGDAPDTQEMIFQYPNLTIHWIMSMINSYGFDFGSGKPARRLGIYFHGSRGTLRSNYGNHETVPEGKYFDESIQPKEKIPSSPGHEREWLDCIKSRKAPSCNPEYHCKIDIPLVLGNLSYRLNRSITFDPKKLEIVGDPEAAKAAIPEYRNPWKFPMEYLKG